MKIINNNIHEISDIEAWLLTIPTVISEQFESIGKYEGTYYCTFKKNKDSSHDVYLPKNYISVYNNTDNLIFEISRRIKFIVPNQNIKNLHLQFLDIDIY